MGDSLALGFFRGFFGDSFCLQTTFGCGDIIVLRECFLAVEVQGVLVQVLPWGSSYRSVRIASFWNVYGNEDVGSWRDSSFDRLFKSS